MQTDVCTTLRYYKNGTDNNNFMEVCKNQACLRNIAQKTLISNKKNSQ